MTNLDSIFKSRDITLPTKVRLVKAMVFPVVMYGCESWTVKTAEPQRIDAFELWCWRRLLRVPWTATRFNQSILKEISPGIYEAGEIHLFYTYNHYNDFQEYLNYAGGWGEMFGNITGGGTISSKYDYNPTDYVEVFWGSL